MRTRLAVLVEFRLIQDRKPYYSHLMPEAKGLVPSWPHRQVRDHCTHHVLPMIRKARQF